MTISGVRGKLERVKSQAAAELAVAVAGENAEELRKAPFWDWQSNFKLLGCTKVNQNWQDLNIDIPQNSCHTLMHLVFRDTDGYLSDAWKQPSQEQRPWFLICRPFKRLKMLACWWRKQPWPGWRFWKSRTCRRGLQGGYIVCYFWGAARSKILGF